MQNKNKLISSLFLLSLCSLACGKTEQSTNPSTGNRFDAANLQYFDDTSEGSSPSNPSSINTINTKTECPSYIYLKGEGQYGSFSGNGAMPAFGFISNKLAEDGTEVSCTYSRPADPNYGTFVASYFPINTTCSVQENDSFLCSGASESTISCPEKVSIGPALWVSYGEYGSSALEPLPQAWEIQGDEMTLTSLLSHEIMESYGAPHTPALRCNYHKFSSVELVKQ